MRLLLVSLAVSLSLSACASSNRDDAAVTSAAVVGAEAMQQLTPVDTAEYRIGGTDLLKVTVFQVADLSFDELRVDAAGNLEMPLIGSIRADGLTPTQLSREIEQRLEGRYLRDPQVNVTVVEAANQKVTVDGAVTKPGVYEMRGRTSLLQAVAMAEGPVRTADLSSVAVFRTVENRRMVAVFDLRAIRAGRSPDPVILGDDVIVVDSSRLSAAMRDVIGALPALGIFAYL